MGTQFTYGAAAMANGRVGILPDAAVFSAAPGTQKKYINLMDEDTFSFSNMNGAGGYTFICGRLESPYYEAIFSAKVINIQFSPTVYKRAITEWNYIQLFNQFGITAPTLTMNNSTGIVTFHYTGTDKSTRKFKLHVYTLPFSVQAVYDDYNADDYRPEPEEETSI